jgi:hypothetical protein
MRLDYRLWASVIVQMKYNHEQDGFKRLTSSSIYTIVCIGFPDFVSSQLKNIFGASRNSCGEVGGALHDTITEL